MSSDNGATWHRALLPANTQTGIADGYLDPSTNRFFYSAYPDTVYSTADLGRSWTAATFDSPLRQDWPRLFSGRPVQLRTSGYPTNIYYCDWTTPTGVGASTRCYKSTDAGVTFATAGPDLLVEPCLNPLDVPGIGHGRGIVDPRTGYIYLPVVSCAHYFVYVSRDEGGTWARHEVPFANLTGATAALDQVQSTAWQQQNLAGHFNPVGSWIASSETSDALTLDSRGRLYAIWIDGSTYMPYLSSSRDGGSTWSRPILAAPTGLHDVVLPSVVMSPKGLLGISYYGTTDQRSWTGYLTVSTDPANPRPTFQTASITPPGQPLMSEPCCWEGSSQEYTAARWAPDGTLWGAFAAVISSGTAEGMVGRLVPISGQQGSRS